MNAVGHAVGFQRAADFADDLLMGGDNGEGERLGGAAQAVEVFGQLEDATVVEAEAFPDGVAALHGGIERADAGLVAVDEPAADVDDQVAVLFVGFLEHRKGLARSVRSPVAP